LDQPETLIPLRYNMAEDRLENIEVHPLPVVGRDEVESPGK
jgi:hypothetical protein